jgi:hypothetical protein
MPPVTINERTILIAILAVIGVATLFCLLGFVTPGWGGHTVFSRFTSSAAALSIISFLLLAGCITVAVIILMGSIQHEYLPHIFLGILIIASLFLLGTIATVTSAVSNVFSFYSYNLMVTSFTFTYLSAIATTYWLFGARGANDKKTTPGQQQQQQQQHHPRLDMS